MIKQLAIVVLSLCGTAGLVRAQGPPQDPLAEHLYPPELVMQHQQKIGLTASQRIAITDAIGKAQGKILNLQWAVQTETEKLVGLLSAAEVNEAAALAQADRVLGVEREIKREHLTLLIRIKNTLTRAQLARLRALREGASD